MLRPTFSHRKRSSLGYAESAVSITKQVNEITLCDVNIQNLLTADLAQPRKATHRDPFFLEEVWICAHDFGRTSEVCVVTLDRHREMVPDLM